MFEKLSFPFGLPVNWDKPESFLPLPANMQSWLLNTASLTERLQSLCDEFRVEVLGQAVLSLDASEQDALLQSNTFSLSQTLSLKQTLSSSQKKAWQIREVVLFGDGKPWVFARSALPDHMCRSTWANLGNQPLGQRIFNDPSFVRSDFEIGHLQVHPVPEFTSNENDIALFGQQQRWARRSVFKNSSNNQHKADTLLVAEAFLPDCPCYAKLK